MDIADTGKWHLLLYISPVSLQAWLRPKTDIHQPGVELFRCEWEENMEGILHEIENAVYDHQVVLDDFSTDIIIETAKCVWVPRDLGEIDGGYEEAFAISYPDDSEEMEIDELQKETCLYFLTPGLKSFLRRTFPGTRIRCHQVLLAAHQLSGNKIDDAEIFCDIRNKEADIVLSRSGELISCLTRSWNEPTDIAWYLFNLMNLHSMNPATAKIRISGNESAQRDLEAFIKPYVESIVKYEKGEIPGIENIPLAARFCYLKQKKDENNQR